MLLAEQVCKRFGERVVLRDLDLCVPPGRSLASSVPMALARRRSSVSSAISFLPIPEP